MTTCNAELTFPPVPGNSRPRAQVYSTSPAFFAHCAGSRHVAVLAATHHGTRHIIAPL
jgi:hypothetical protein